MCKLRKNLSSNRMVEVGRDLWRSSGPNPFLGQVIHDYVQLAFEYRWGRRVHSIPGQSVPSQVLATLTVFVTGSVLYRIVQLKLY